MGFITCDRSITIEPRHYSFPICGMLTRYLTWNNIISKLWETDKKVKLSFPAISQIAHSKQLWLCVPQFLILAPFHSLALPSPE